MATAFQTGTLHITNEINCQDYAASCRADGYCCIALADGAGSVDRSEISSRAAVEYTTNEMCNAFERWFLMTDDKFTDKLIDQCILTAHEIDPQAGGECTLLFIAVSTDDGRYICGHIGDGVIFSISDDEIEILSGPENGEEPNETFFLSGKHARDHLYISRGEIEEGSSIILCSDGISGSLWNPFTDEFADALHRIPIWLKKYSEEDVSDALGRELNETFRSRSHDDMSIAVLTTVASE